MGEPMRNSMLVLASFLACSFASPALGQEASSNALQIEIQSPSADFSAVNGETTIEVDGIASAIGGVRYLDMIFVMDTSASLKGTDPGQRLLALANILSNLSRKK